MELMDIRRGLMSQMAGNKNYITGTIVLDSPQASIEISVPFTPKLYSLVLRSMDSSVSSYQSIMAIGGVWTNTDGATIPANFNGGYYTLAEATPTTSRTISAALPTYSDGKITLLSRNATFPWAKGTYDYIIVG